MSRRSTATALITAAVLGVGGGVGLALEQRPDPSPASNAGSPAELSATEAARLQRLADDLLWAEPGALHDGDVVRRLDGLGRPASVARTPDGWVVATAVPGRPGVVDVAFVPRGPGAPSPIARLRVGWALDDSGTRVAGQTPDDPRPGVWALDGRRTATYDLFEVRGRTYADWSGPDVVFSQPIAIEGGLGDPRWMQTVWNPRTDATVGFMGDFLPTGWERMRVSPDGRYAGGASNPEAFSSRDDPNRCLGVEEIPRETPQGEPRVVWNTCDWRPLPDGPAWSPDGRRILAVPADEDPSSPRSVGLLDAVEGPGAPVTRIALPAGTTAVSWTDAGGVVAASQQDGRVRLSACDASGCVTLRARPTGPVALG